MSTARPAPPASTTPDRVRHRRAWRDPRIAVGVALVAGSVVLGALVLGGDDPGVPVWQVRADLAPGAVVEPDDLEPVRVVLPAEVAGAYVSAASPLREGTVARRGVAAGELLPSAALRSDGPALEQVPVATADAGVPGTIRPGSVVDVYVAAVDGLDGADAEQVLDDVTVISLPTGAALGGGAPQPLVVGVDSTTSTDLGRVVARLAAGDAVVVGQG